MIKLVNVSKVFPGGTRAVDGVSLEVGEGQIACLIGESGCGKTTTLRMINRLAEPTSGDIYINGESILKKDPVELRRSMGYVIQRVGLLPHLSIQDNVALLLEAQGKLKAERRKQAEGLLELVGLDPALYAGRYPSQLSGGQAQRVGIARALAGSPPILLMDEPFGALDPITRARMQKELWRLNQQLKKTIVLVTHDLSEAFRLGDEIFLMYQGKVLQKGHKEDFLKNPVNDYAAEFVRSQVEALER